MGDVVNLPIALDSDLGRALVSDLARYSEGICSELEVRKRHHFDESTWNALADNENCLRRWRLKSCAGYEMGLQNVKNHSGWS